MVYSANIREEAERLHKKGLSYEAISVKLGVAKSTLSTWIGRSPRPPSDRKKQLAHLARIRILSAAANKRKRQQWIDASHSKGKALAHKVESGDATRKALLAMLY